MIKSLSFFGRMSVSVNPEVLLNDLVKKVSFLKERILAKETARLRKENLMLQSEVTQLKLQLTQAQLLNGAKLYSVPGDNTILEARKNLGSKPETEAKAKPLTPIKVSEPPVDAPTPVNNVQTPKNKKIEAKEKKKEEKSAKKPAPDKPTRAVDVSLLDMRIGLIKSVKKHPDADTLYVEEIDCGEEFPRVVCSGLVNSMPASDLENRLVIVMCNLKPVKMRGIVSQAMVMCASSSDKVEVLDPPDGAKPGDRVIFPGYEGKPEVVLNPKKKIFETVQPDFLVTDDGIATWKGVPFTIESIGVCKAKTARNMGIK